MINFPVFEHLVVRGYGLYPGRNQDDELSIQFDSGLTLVLGANGLGKTTLITMIFRALAGPYDLRSSAGDSLGTTALDHVEIGSERRRTFGQRVRDGAENAEVTLVFLLGARRFSVTRSLRNLQLRQFSDGNQLTPLADEDAYQESLCSAAGVHAFGDFLLVLRHLMFFFEDRRSLVWDNAAQRQILRALFLDPVKARQWSELERTALQLDSELRNVQAVATKSEKRAAQSGFKKLNESDLRVQIATERDLQEADNERQEFLGTETASLDESIARLRLDLLRAEQEADSAQREVERAELTAIERAYPSLDSSMRYIFAQLVSDCSCRACGQDSPRAVARMHDHLENRLCAICDLPLPAGEVVPPGALAAERIQRARAEAIGVQSQLHAARRAYRETAEEYAALQQELATLSDAIQQRFRKLKSLYDQLPPEEAILHGEQESVRALQVQVEILKARLAKAQVAFSVFVAEQTSAVQIIAEKLQAAFTGYAQDFLLEKVSLSWAPVSQRLGVFRDNPFIEFPAFALDVTGSDFSEPVRRDGPGQVSESQREFIDLAFRMALIDVAGLGSRGTLIIDAPESSLDAVFVHRAASVMGKFAVASAGNRLIVTSNILPGELLKNLIAASTTEHLLPKIVDLFEEGRPTAAILQFGGEYQVLREELKRHLVETSERRQPHAAE